MKKNEKMKQIAAYCSRPEGVGGTVEIENRSVYWRNSENTILNKSNVSILESTITATVSTMFVKHT